MESHHAMRLAIDHGSVVHWGTDFLHADPRLAPRDGMPPAAVRWSRAMPNIWDRMVEKAVDKGCEWVVIFAMWFVGWLVCSPLWGGWRGAAIGLALAFATLGIVMIYKRKSRYANAPSEGRAFFVGRWRCGHGDPQLGTFILTLNQDGTVHKDHVPEVVGHWTYSNGAARSHTSDRWRDILRRTPEAVIKFAYDEGNGVLLDSSPSNLSLAERLPATQV